MHSIRKRTWRLQFLVQKLTILEVKMFILTCKDVPRKMFWRGASPLVCNRSKYPFRFLTNWYIKKLEPWEGCGNVPPPHLGTLMVSLVYLEKSNFWAVVRVNPNSFLKLIVTAFLVNTAVHDNILRYCSFIWGC